MRDGGTRPGIGRFRGAGDRARFLAAYDEAFHAWPLPRDGYDIATDFGTTYVHRSGPRAGEPIVLLHGAGGNASNWVPQIAAFAERHPVYAVDTIDDPGRSVQTAVMTGSADAARWLDQTLAGLGLDRVHLVGQSYGGWLALNQAAHSTDRIASATLLDPGGLEKVRAGFYVNMVAGALATIAPRRLRPWLARRLAQPALVMDPRDLAPVMIGARRFGPQRSAARPFTDDELRGVKVPLLALLAERSVLLHPERARNRVQRLAPGAEAEIIPGVGHGLTLEEPELVNARVLRFVEGERG